MANSVVEALYTTIKQYYEPSILVRYPYSFDENAIPYMYFYQVDDIRLKNALCDSDGGTARFTFGYLSETIEDCVNKVEEMIGFIKSLTGDYGNVKIETIKAESVKDLTGLEDAQKKVYRREFDIITSWSK